MSPVASDLVTSLLQPIQGAAPCGALLDIDTEDDLLWIQDQIEKTGAFGSGEVDWAGILDRSRRLFSERSKDWGLACYVVRGLYHRDGHAGLLAGLEFLHESVAVFWKDMHPVLPAGLRKRSNLLEWLVAGLADDLVRKPAPAPGAETAQALRDRVGSLDGLLSESFGPAYPGTRLLREALAKQQAQPEPEAAGGPASANPVATQGTAPAAEGEFPPPIQNADVADVVLSKCRQGIFAACDVLHAQDSADARPYRLRRLAAWMNFTATPPADDGQIAVMGPEEGEADRLRGVLGSDPKGVLIEAEGRLQSSPLWLDAQQVAVAALERLGASHLEARAVVRQETRSFLQRLPGLRALRFANGTPLADETTGAWLDGEVLVEAAPAEPEAPAAAPADGRLGEAAARAAELAAQGEIEKSLEIFAEALRTIPSGRERFRWRLAAARHCGRVGQTALALDLLEGLDREAAQRDLEGWEPELGADLVGVALRLGKKGRAPKGPPLALVTERMPELTKRLARLDLLAALRMSTKEH